MSSSTSRRSAQSNRLVFRFSVFFAVLLIGPAPSGWPKTYSSDPVRKPAVLVVPLDSGWHFREVSKQRWYPATVPGCVVTDLLSSGLIENPFLRDNAEKLQWVGQTYWIYETTLLATPDLLGFQKIELIFKGLDTYARLFLNGVPLASTDNMFREWRLDCKKMLKPGANKLEVHFASAVNRVLPSLRHAAHPLPAPSDPGEKTSPYTRKAPYQYGWDWAPRLTGAGIWKPVFLEAWNHARIADLQIFQKNVQPSAADLTVRLDVLSTVATTARISLRETSSDRKVFDGPFRLQPGRNQVTIDWTIPEPLLWWPNGLGPQPLYKLAAQLSVDGKILDRFSRRIGIRTLELRQLPDAWGKSFEFVVNGVPLFAKGGNWVPADAFPARVTAERYRALIHSCRDANMNMLRVWGGGIYESDVFYDLCDEMGILVWQDFIFANALYPASQSFFESVRQEAADNIKRLRNHPSLGLWCGNNEVETGWFDWGWKKRFPASFWEDYKQLFHDVLPGACATWDPGRPYWPSSPSSNLEDKPNAQSAGDVHYWDIWLDGLPFKSYQAVVPRFLSEYGFQSFPNFKTIEWFTGSIDLQLESPAMAAHQKGDRGTERIRKAVSQIYGEPKDFASFVYLSQLTQAEAIRTGAEHLRRNRPRAMGSLYWQINDCWPAISWSGIDYFGRWKALHYYARRFYQDVLVSPYEENGEIKIAVASDRTAPAKAVLKAQVIRFDGTALLEARKQVTLAPMKSEVHWTLRQAALLEGRDSRQLLLNCQLFLDGVRVSSNRFLFHDPKDLRWPRPTITVKTRNLGGKLMVGLLSNSFAKDVELSLAGHEGTFVENYFDLLPADPIEVEFRPEGRLTPEELRSSLRIHSLADAIATK